METRKEGIMIKRSEGLLKVFISSTFRDLQIERHDLIEKLNLAISPIGMEFFIPDGKTSHEIALLDENCGLKNSDIVIFLVSPNYGSEINECKISYCKAECPLKEIKNPQKISYTHCEYKFAKAENKPFLIYLFDEESWDLLQPLYQMEKIDWEGDNPIFKIKTVDEIKNLYSAKEHIIEFRREINSSFCPRINNDSISQIPEHLAENIIKWYYEGRIFFQEFYGRKKELKSLCEKLNESTEVYGVGGIGKTTLIHIALLIQILKGRKVIVIGKKQSYLSGSGYNLFKEKCKNIIYEITTDRITLNDIIDALKFKEVQTIDGINDKIQLILTKIQSENYLFFIDDFHLADDNVRRLVKQSHNFIISSKRKSGIARNEIPLIGIEKTERNNLIDLISRRLGKVLKLQDIEKISEFSEGHPITMEILVRNIEIINFEKLEDYKKDVLDFSNNDQVEEFNSRVIEGILSKEAFILLKNLSIINTSIDTNINLRVVEKTFNNPSCKKNFIELVNSGILKKNEKTEGAYQFTFKHIQDAVREDNIYYNKSALNYYENKSNWSTITIDDEIERFYHQIKSHANVNFIKIFNKLREKVNPINFGYKRLIEIGLFLREQMDSEEEKAELCHGIGLLVYELNHYRDAKELYEEAINIYIRLSERNREKYAQTLTGVFNSLGNLYQEIHKYEQAKECYERSLVFLRDLNNKKKNSQLVPISIHLANLGIVYAALKRPDDAKNAYIESLKIRKNLARQNQTRHLPVISKITMNLASLYQYIKDYPEALKKYKEGIKIVKNLSRNNPAEYLNFYATSLSSLGGLYAILHNEIKAGENFNQALTYLHDLSEINPDAYLPDYVNALSNYAIFNQMINNIPEAEEYAKLALTQAKILAIKCPAVYNLQLSRILGIFGRLFHILNRPDLSLSFYNDQLALSMELNRHSPGIYIQNISESLLQIGLIYERLNKFSDAKTTLNQCLKIRTQLLQKCHEAYVDDYSDILLELIRLNEKEKLFDNDGSIILCEKYRRKLNDNCPQAFKSHLVDTLLTKGKMFAIRHDPQYIVILNECLKYSEDLLNLSSNIYTQYHGSNCNLIGYCFLINNDRETAQKLFEKSLQYQQKYFENCPDAFNADYADLLNNLGYLKIYQDKLGDAEIYLRKSLEIRKKLFNNCASAFCWEYSDTLNKLGYCKMLQNELNEAEIYLNEAQIIEEDLLKKYRDPFIDHYAIMKSNLGFLNFLKENYPLSKNNFEEALLIQKGLADKNPNIYRVDYLDTLKKYAQLLFKMSPSDELERINREIFDYSKN